MVVDDLTPIHNALACLHHTTGNRHALQQRILHLLRHIGIVGHILNQVIINITRLQLRPIQRGWTIIDNELVSRTHGKQITDIARLRHRVLPDIDALTLLFTQPIPILCRDDAIAIQFVQAVLHILHVGARHLAPQLRIIIGTQLFYLLGDHLCIQPEIGLKRAQDAVSLTAHLLVGLINREITRSSQQTVTPRLPLIKLIPKLSLPREEISDK